MKTTILKEGNPMPTVHVTVNKNRVKIYDNNKYYLQDGQTFEIELFNPTKTKIKADITLDGNLISAGGLVLKPGQRVYLERFVDSDNKFLFETYEVEDSEEVAEAISQNGMLEVKFYRELQSFIYPTTLQSPWSSSWGGWNNVYYSTTNIIDTNAPMPDNLFTTTFSTTDGTVGNSVLRSTINTSNETGRTEKGEASGQTFDVSYDNFDIYVFKTVEYKILPVSKQPITKKDLNVKRYCHECGAVTKVKFKFCPSCGEKL